MLLAEIQVSASFAYVVVSSCLIFGHFEPQSLEKGAAYKKIVYLYNCQGIYAIVYKHKLCKNKEAEIGKKQEQLRKI